MLIEVKEDTKSDFQGTIIDIETVGEFLNQYTDSRHFRDIRLVIFGFINKDGLQILCARGPEGVLELRERTHKIIDSLERPFYAYNTEFERSVLFYELGKEIDFGGELQVGRESKATTRNYLDIPNYDDPFYDRGVLCMRAWQDGEFGRAIAHNRACLLKERDILLKRKCGTPCEITYIR